MSSERILFVTGRLAEPSLRQVLEPLAQRIGFDYEVSVLGISVAALMRVDWICRKLPPVQGVQRVIVPGWCGGELQTLSDHFGVPFERGPKDLFDLPEYFGQQGRPHADLKQYSIEILAEINHASHLAWDALIRQAEWYRRSGADLIDLGCVPGETWCDIGDTVRRLMCEGFRVSVDSFHQPEVEAAVEAGAELVLSCNQSNRDWARHLPVELVVIPDDPRQLNSWGETLQILGRQPVRLDPVLEPIGFGFASSLARYYETRRLYPDAEMMMGIGNLTELTEVDSAGVNFLLAALCEELRIGSILTTEVINWGRTAVREFDIARRLVRHSLANRVLPKHLGGELVMLRDPRLHELGEQGLQQLSSRLTDPNFRIFAERGEIHLMNRDGYWHGSDPYEVFDRMVAAVGTLTAEHAFYLGMELCKARTALTLGKQYTQDEALRWGFLTVEEISAVDRRRRESAGRLTTESGDEN
ncbi:MAG: dihydropteroate synthase [Planctomycetes bacterium]|nr:dihydropteroate synthase [Planctomycetota bacterium]